MNKFFEYQSRGLRRLQATAGVIMATTLLLHFTGCAGYRLGSSLPPNVRSVYVPTFINDTDEPSLETEVTRAVIQEFQRDGTLHVLDKSQADVVIDVRLVKFELEPLRYNRDQAKTAEEYRMRISAKLVLTRISTGEVMSERSVQGENFFDFSGDMGTSKRTALPLAAADLAHDIVESVVEYW
ncbi:MAG: LptE family protein [Verrucomicrobia bacterium]|nr:LptE family protein [Verrucomicrobiota bacterium]